MMEESPARDGCRSAPEAGTPPGAAARTYRRTAGTRILSAASALLFGGATVSVVAGRGPGVGALLAGALTILSLANLITAFGDRYTLGESGVVYSNRWLTRVGCRPRALAWTDVARVREHRRLQFGRADPAPSAVLLTARSGRKLVLDSLEDFDEVLRTVRRYCGRERPADG